MKIIVGSKNPNKIASVAELFSEYDVWINSEIEGVAAPSGVSDQPKSLEETITGAINRARAAFVNCDYGVGLESGLVAAPFTKSGYFDFCVCAIFDGEQIHLGVSSGFEYPPKIIQHIENNGGEIDDAVKAVGFDLRERVGYAEGMVGLLTRGRVTRKDHCQQAVRTALIHLENKDWY